MANWQVFFSKQYQILQNASFRMQEDELLRGIITEFQQSQRFWSILLGYELDAIPVVVIRDYAVLQKLVSTTNAPFAELSVAELVEGLRVDRFLAMGVRWLLLEDSTAPAPPSDTRVLVNYLLGEARRQAVAWLLKLSAARVGTLQFHLWTPYLNCALGRRACLHFRVPHVSYNKIFLQPKGDPTIWRLLKWGEGKTNQTYVDLYFGLLPELQVRQTFCFPKSELHCLASITFEGQELLTNTGACQHVQDNLFWMHRDPHIRDAEPQHDSSTESELSTCETTVCLTDGSPSEQIALRKTKSCPRLRDPSMA
jgi:hypothetical protein